MLAFFLYHSQMISLVKTLAALSCAATFAGAANAADCFDYAAHYHQVNADVLRSIAIKENPRCDGTVRRNNNDSIDVGCMQINSIHFKELASYGIYPDDLQDQCKNIFVGAWHLKKQIRKYGETWTAVGAYHDRRPKYRDPYAADVKRIWEYYFAGRR